MHVYSTDLFDDSGKMIASGFSSHWAACAAMIRLSDPTFKSLGGDRPADLEIEKAMALERAQVAA